MRFIVTGSEGFIGRSLVKTLKSKGAEVVGIDRKYGVERSRIFDATNVWEMLEEKEYDGVFHLAASTSVFNSDVQGLADNNISVFMTVAQACHKHNVKLVYASSSCANPANITSMYGITKHFDELFAKIYCPSATGVRLHNVYGPDPRKGTLLWHLLNDERVTLVNNGANRRHFTYVDNAVEGLIYAYGTNEQVVNVANPECDTVRDFADLVQGFNGVELSYNSQKRDYDKLEQAIDEDIYSVPLPYVGIAEGISRVFAPSRAD